MVVLFILFTFILVHEAAMNFTFQNIQCTKYEHEINMHNADTVLDKAPGQEAFCTVYMYTDALLVIIFHYKHTHWTDGGS